MNYNDMAHMADQERKREREEGMEPTPKTMMQVTIDKWREMTAELEVLRQRVAELEAELERMREGIAIMKETHKATSDLCDLRDREIARLREENAKMGALLERFQVGIQMSGYSTDWQKHLDDIDEQFLREGEDGQLSNAGHDLSDSCADSFNISKINTFQSCCSNVLACHHFRHRGSCHSGDVTHAVKRDCKNR